jgi:hypothetical protein
VVGQVEQGVLGGLHHHGCFLDGHAVVRDAEGVRFLYLTTAECLRRAGFNHTTYFAGILR